MIDVITVKTNAVAMAIRDEMEKKFGAHYNFTLQERHNLEGYEGLTVKAELKSNKKQITTVHYLPLYAEAFYNGILNGIDSVVSKR